jgi:hypothetical protein
MALGLKCGDGVFPLREQHHGEKPDGQGQRGLGEERPGGERGPVSAVPALHRLARVQGDDALGMPPLRGIRRPAAGSDRTARRRTAPRCRTARDSYANPNPSGTGCGSWP